MSYFGPRACLQGRIRVQPHPSGRALKTGQGLSPPGISPSKEGDARRKKTERRCGAWLRLLSDSYLSLNARRWKVAVADRFLLFIAHPSLANTQDYFTHVPHLSDLYLCMYGLLYPFVRHSEIIVGHHLRRNSCRNYSVYVSLPSSFLLEASSIGNQPCLRKPQSFPQPKGGDGEVTNNTENIEDNNIRIPYTRDIVHVDEVEHAPCVPEFGTVVEERFRENATVAIVPMVLRYDEPRVANLRRDKVQQDALV